MIDEIYPSHVQGFIVATELDIGTLEAHAAEGRLPNEDQCNRLLMLTARLECLVKIARGERVGRCVQCDREFPRGRVDQRYCSNACRQKAYRLRTECPHNPII